MIKGLMKQVRVRDELLKKQEELLVQERKSNKELKKLLALEKSKVEKLDQELAQSKQGTCSLKSSISALKDQHNVLQKIHQDLEVQFDALWSNTSKTPSDPQAPKASTRKGCERCYNLDLNALCDKSQPSKVEQVLVESCDEAIGKENDHLKGEVKRLQFEVNKLKKQTNVQSPEDNPSNIVKKLEKGRTAPKIVFQQQTKQVHHKKEENNLVDEKVEYARSAYLNARRSHIKNGIGYKTNDEHNSRVNTKGQEFIKFIKANVQQEKKQNTKTTNNASYAHANASHVSHMSYHDFYASYVLIRNKSRKVIALHVGPHHKR
jgi:hypothetical protein